MLKFKVDRGKLLLLPDIPVPRYVSDVCLLRHVVRRIQSYPGTKLFLEIMRSICKIIHLSSYCLQNDMQN